MTPRDASLLVRRLHTAVNKLVAAERHMEKCALCHVHDASMLAPAAVKLAKAREQYVRVRDDIHYAILDKS